jgi:hypothetical protein
MNHSDFIVTSFANYLIEFLPDFVHGIYLTGSLSFNDFNLQYDLPGSQS